MQAENQMSNTMKNLVFLLLASYYLALTTKGIDLKALTAEEEVHVLNNLKTNPNSLKVHCWSGEDDLGDRPLYKGQDYNWRFHDNVITFTVFNCSFSWGAKHNAFVAYDSAWKDICSTSARPCHQTYWSVRDDGFYYSIMINPNPRTYAKKYDWLQ